MNHKHSYYSYWDHSCSFLVALFFFLVSIDTFCQSFTTSSSTTTLFASTISTMKINHNNNENNYYSKRCAACVSRLQMINDPWKEDDDEEDTSEILSSLTVAQLKQQLRLRGLKVTGRKQDLIDRLLEAKSTSFQNEEEEDIIFPELVNGENDKTTTTTTDDDRKKKTKAQIFAEQNGKEFVDVTAYVDPEFKDQEFQTTKNNNKVTDNNNNNDNNNNEEEEGSEVWGEDAKITMDYNIDNPVVDNLSRTRVEFSGANKEKVSAFVVASRESLKGYLAGGSDARRLRFAKKEIAKKNNRKRLNNNKNEDGQSSSTNKNNEYLQDPNIMTPEQQVRQIQERREREARVPRNKLDQETDDGIDDPTDDPISVREYKTIERDYSDWGVYTSTGAQISSNEVEGILFLSDVRGPFSEDNIALCEKIAFECQPCVVLAPDVFRGKPWDGSLAHDDTKKEKKLNSEGQTYEEWRDSHSDLRVNIDIRASAMLLRERYGVSSIAVWGVCYGGGRALEAAAGFVPEDDDDTTSTSSSKSKSKSKSNSSVLLPPDLVNPSACIAWYPTRYNASTLFGKNRKLGTASTSDFISEPFRQPVAIMGIFADQDTIPGATPEDAMELKQLLDSDERVKDNMIKVFNDQPHGFAHVGLGEKDELGSSERHSIGGGDGEVAALLSTAFLETYTRMFLPTVGTPVKEEDANGWNQVEMKRSFNGDSGRDIRAEIEAAEKEYEQMMDEVDFDFTDVSEKFW